MPAKIISTKSAEHYKWGGPQATDCDGWHLVKTPELSVIEELMPPATKETRHSHVHARQFFYVLEGELTLEIEYHEFVLQKGEGIEVSPGQRHQALNKSASPVRIIVTSQPRATAIVPMNRDSALKRKRGGTHGFPAAHGIAPQIARALK